MLARNREVPPQRFNYLLGAGDLRDSIDRFGVRNPDRVVYQVKMCLSQGRKFYLNPRGGLRDDLDHVPEALADPNRRYLAACWESDAIDACKSLSKGVILVDEEFNSSQWLCIAGSPNIGDIRIPRNS